MKTILYIFLILSSLGFSRDYKKYDHKVFIDSLRSGNHDESGENTYFFTYQIIALRHTKEDLILDYDKREKITREVTRFGDLEIPVLKEWDKAAPLELEVLGSDVRALIAEAMKTFKVTEQEIIVQVKLVMYEEGKWLFFFGEDLEIAKTQYFPIPAKNYAIPEGQNIKLELKDDKGLNVVIKVDYKKDEPVKP